MKSSFAPARGLRAAFVFLSRLPLGGFPYAASEWRWAPAHFPCVGIVVGALSAAVFALGWRLSLSPLVVAGLVLVTSVLLTGAMHEDGLADSCDGLGGAHGGKRALEIMKDSRIGTYGACALMLSFLVRASAVAALPASAWFVLIQVHCVARLGPVWLMTVLPYVTDGGLSKSAALFDTRAPQAATALAWVLACSAFGVGAGLLSPAAAAAALAAHAGASWACGWYLRRALGGVTGDVLGLAEQAGEIAVLLALLSFHAA